MKKISLKLKYHNNSSMAITAGFYAIALFLNQVGLVPRYGSTPEATFDQLSSVNTPHYALIAMVMPFFAAITCIIKLCLQGWKGRSCLEVGRQVTLVLSFISESQAFRNFP
ncbi:hypothetical protein GOBAR_DD28598 [Gossypium barbadense]|nr:hypothetical protein GOBAR_DD28598 [Gossypium barbadense]